MNTDNIQNIDPSPTHKYTKWLKRQYAEGYTLTVLKDVITIFDMLVTRKILKGKESDIYNYKTVADIYDLFNSMNIGEYLKTEDPRTLTKTGREKILKEQGTNLIYEDDHYKVIKLLTPEAAKEYAHHTKWCIADPRQFDQIYMHYGATIYIVFDKKRSVDDPKYKIAVTAYPDIVDGDEEFPFDLQNIMFEINDSLNNIILPVTFFRDTGLPMKLFHS